MLIEIQYPSLVFFSFAFSRLQIIEEKDKGEEVNAATQKDVPKFTKLKIWLEGG